jgi:hypothetical protein
LPKKSAAQCYEDSFAPVPRRLEAYFFGLDKRQVVAGIRQSPPPDFNRQQIAEYHIELASEPLSFDER